MSSSSKVTRPDAFPSYHGSSFGLVLGIMGVVLPLTPFVISRTDMNARCFVFSTLSMLTFLVSTASFITLFGSRSEICTWQFYLPGKSRRPSGSAIFLRLNFAPWRPGDLRPFSFPHHASCGLSHNLSFPLSSSVFGEPNLAIVVIILCIRALANNMRAACNIFVLSSRGKFLCCLSDLPLSYAPPSPLQCWNLQTAQ